MTTARTTTHTHTVRRARENGRTLFKVFAWYDGEGNAEEFTVVAWQNAYDQTSYSCLACAGDCSHVAAVRRFVKEG